MPKDAKIRINKINNLFSNDAKIVIKSYLQNSSKFKNVEIQETLESTITKFNLNSDQECAFRIVANHAIYPESERLSMYLGGMGGAGKSQVIKALILFFSLRNEKHRFMILAPTGSAAALLNGSTYHSALGINDRTQSGSIKNLAQICTRLEGVDYIFLDEVSMLSCHDTFKISSQLAKATNEYEEPFGGMNMIFAGDFAQLTPVQGAVLYSGNIGTELLSSMSLKKTGGNNRKGFVASNYNSGHIMRKYATKQTVI